MHQNLPGIAIRYFFQVNLRDLGIHGLNYTKHYHNTLRQRNRYWSPTTVGIEITYRCTGDCDDCYIPTQLRGNAEVMGDYLFRKIVSESLSNGINFIGLVGGEPIQKSTLPLILPVLEEHPYTSFFIYTNGDYFARNGLNDFHNIHNLAFSVSVDGFRDSHNSIRHRGSFENVVESFSALKGARKFYGASITIRRSTLDELADSSFLEFLSDKGVKFAHFMKVKTEDENNLSGEEFASAIKRIKSHSTKYPVFVIFGGYNDGRGISPEFEYRDIFISLYGEVRIKKGDIQAVVGDISREPLEKIIERINPRQLVQRANPTSLKENLNIGERGRTNG